MSTGLFCDEIKDETQCETRYGQSCETIRHWVATAEATCESRGQRNCLSFTQLIKHRPVTQQERVRRGRGKYGAQGDPLRALYAIDRDKASDRDRMEKVLRDLPLGHRNLKTSRLSCTRKIDPALNYSDQ